MTTSFEGMYNGMVIRIFILWLGVPSREQSLRNEGQVTVVRPLPTRQHEDEIAQTFPYAFVPNPAAPASPA